MEVLLYSFVHYIKNRDLPFVKVEPTVEMGHPRRTYRFVHCDGVPRSSFSRQTTGHPYRQYRPPTPNLRRPYTTSNQVGFM